MRHRGPLCSRTLAAVPDLVALDIDGGEAFVSSLLATWSDGDAAFPLDRRLRGQARQEVIDAISPSRVLGDEDLRHLDGRPVADGDALVVATSGSEGAPRGVVLTHDALVAGARAVSERLEVEPGRDRWLACLPRSHMGGLGVIVRSLVTGTAVDVHDGFDAARVGAAARAGANLVSLVTPLLRRISPELFRTILLGGASPPPEIAPNVVATYGMTETGGGVVYDGIPLDGTEVKVVDEEIHLRGPTLLRCYRDGTDPRDADGWIRTGDIGHMSRDGRLEVIGRRSDMIITGGENVWPEPVERRLLEHHAVADVAVVGRPDADRGQIVVAIVVPAAAAGAPDAAELSAHVAETLPRFMAPRAVELRDHLPRTTLGKLRRRLL